ncbi:uncharacterized protein TRIVIDRAFT_193915 [Trichoderma virens Gv29-8]|uniref:Uncharacterized protein n=1 Tax=Hypocrea virens (strain Gv29-8 / FGSC 10586) TaxID=413071 RepID=G9N3F1_HYPVG|nr:uncharacterized protein TRIVIDRAFT_193915 [Trichoderma virens Gv29-8]EHK18835.1 hypothetical protein TRIVIDRAFT_193915 [Trichoderma virens Gv29-8]
MKRLVSPKKIQRPIVAAATSSFKSQDGTTKVPVTLETCNTKLKLLSQGSQRYAGIINDAALARVLQEFTIKVDAKLLIPTTLRKRTSKTLPKEIYSPVNCDVRIIFYGLAADQNTIGNILGDAGLYFQHPLSSEYNSNVRYWNPHYLLRPGSQMPTPEEAEEDPGTRCDRAMESDLLNTSNEGRFMRLFDEASDSNLKTNIEPSRRLRSTLKEHQISALAWLTGIEARGIRDGVSSLWEPEMGLGKSLSILALICSSLDIMEVQKTGSEETQSRQSCTTLIVTPKSSNHIHPGALKIAIYHGSDRQKLQDSLQNSDITLTTYETMRRDWEENGALFTRQWLRVVLDEAHHIRARDSKTFKAACDIQARSRWCLTGTPIHNSLDDFAALLSFVGVPVFMKKSLFDFWITRPIKENHLCGLQRLRLLIKGTCLRRTKKLIKLSDQLPDPREQITWVELLPADRDLYTFFEKEAANIASGSYRYNIENSNSNDQKNNNILKFINALRLICDHGEYLLPRSAVELWRTPGDNLIDWQKVQKFREACNSRSAIGFHISCPQVMCRRCLTSTGEVGSKIESTHPDSSLLIRSDGEGSYSTIDIRPGQQSPKLEALIENLRQEQLRFAKKPQHSVVFSCWTRMIDLTQQCLEANGFVCARIDGQKSLEARSKAMNQFNLDPKCTVMLATLGSAAEGVNFTAANSVHLLEPHWNPMVEAQAVDRVHRIGQSRKVLITRYLTKDTIEMYVQWIQKEKIRLIQQSLDSHDISQLDTNGQRWKVRN